jgi:hypothetical protein
MLHRKCLGLDADTPLLFPSTANLHEPRKTEELTKLLKRCTASATDVALSVRVYRQLTIAITEKHIKQMSQPFNRYDDTTSIADSGVAFTWQSGHRPIQRSTSYGLDSAFPDSLQPALLRLYKWVSEEWHRFLNLDRNLLAPASSDATLAVSTMRTLVMCPIVYDIDTPVANLVHRNDKQHPNWEGQTKKRSGPSVISDARQYKKQKRLEHAAQPGQSNSARCHSWADSELCAQAEIDTSLSGNPWAIPVEIETLRRAPSIQWPSCSAIFGQVSQLEKPDTLEERTVILTAIRDEEECKNRYFHDDERLRVSDSLRKWSNVRCQLCFLQTNEPQPDHALLKCRLWACCGQARAIWH